MHRRLLESRAVLAVAVVVVASSVFACATQEDPANPDGTWVGTTRTEGNVTTVVNESGSVWGGTARLVEEASIGAVPAEHKEWERRQMVASQRQYVASLAANRLAEDDPDFDWDGAEIPDHKPAYLMLVPALSDETWVVRWGASGRLADCAENPIEEGVNASYARPCWDNENIFEVFGADGRCLGEVGVPHRVSLGAFSVDDRRIVTTAVDDNEIARVKQYRLVLPGEQ